MKKILLPLLATALFIPMTSFASDSSVSNDMVQSIKFDQEVLSHQENEKLHQKMHKKTKFNKMTEKEKEEFFDKKIAEMESDIKALKGMTLEQKEDWFKNKKNHMNKKRKHMVKMCEKLKKNELHDFSYEKALEKMKNSKKFKHASIEKQNKMINRLNEFEKLPQEEKDKKIKERREKLKTFCKKH